MASDDDDAYLYSDEEPAQKKQKVEEAEPVPPSQSDDSGESESDDDVEFVIEDPSAKPVPPSINASAPPLNDAISEVTDAGAEGSGASETKKADHVNVQKDDGSATINVNAVAEYEGKPLTQLDLDTLKEKPWRAPGADISDYFNYGFDEFTWTAYCHKQDSTRGEFNPQKVMAKMMGGPGGKAPFFPFPPNMGNGNMPMPNMPMPNMPMPNMPMPNMPIPGGPAPGGAGGKKSGHRGGRNRRR